MDVKHVLLLVLSVWIALLVSSIVHLDPWLTWQAGAIHLILNAAPLLLFTLVLYGLTRRVSTSALCTLICLAFIFQINQLKLDYLEEPFIFADLYLAPQILQGRDLFQQYVSPARVGLVILLGAAAVLTFTLEKPLIRRATGLSVALLGIGTIASLSFVHLPMGSLYKYVQGDSLPWDYRTLAENQGLVASLVSGAKLTKFSTPEVDERVISRFLAEEADSGQPGEAAASRPDIILWLAESFFEPSIITGVDGCGMLPDWCELKKTGIASEIRVDTYGGNTTRTEFEVLTGVPFSLLSGHDYPYLSVVNRPFPSIAWELKDSGYRTLAIHTHLRTFWQRHRALPFLGFDRYEGEASFRNPEREGFWISDMTLARRVIDRLPEGGPPTFIFPISMESHGPWGQRKGLDEAAVNGLPAPGGLDMQGRRNWQEYLYHARNAVKTLRRLVETVQQRDKPTLLVFFGDHLPALASVFEQVEFKNGRNAPQQPLPVLAVANYPLKSDWKPGSADELGIWTLYLAGRLGDGPFSDLHAALRALRAQPGSTLASSALEELQERQFSLRPEPADR